SKAVSRGRGNREDLRSSGGAAAAALSQAVRAPSRRGAGAYPPAEPARRPATEVYGVRDRLVHPAAQDGRLDATRGSLPRDAGFASRLLLLPVDLRQHNRSVCDVRYPQGAL